MPLTDKQCKAFKEAEKPYRKTDSRGMYLEVMPNGSKYWRLKYRYNNKEKRMALGVYPDISLLQAREKREEAKKLLANGIDPMQIKKEQKRLRLTNAENSFEVVAREWHEKKKKGWSESHANNVLHRLESDIFSQIGNRPVAEISPAELLDSVRRIEKRGAYEVARRTLGICSQVFIYAIGTSKRTDTNPATGLVSVLESATKSHFAALDVKDLPEFVRTLESNKARLYEQTQRAVKLMLLTFVRTSELINATWDEFDFENKVWTIPAERMKMKKEHIVPLSDQALELFSEQRALTGDWKWVFPNQVRPAKSMSNNTILKALERMGYKGRMTGHGFRALAMSAIKQELGYRHEVIDRQLAHAPKSKIDKAYDRAMFLEERTKMMQDWADYIQSKI